MCCAASENRYRQMVLLVENGVDPRSQDNDKRTPLHLCTSHGNLLAVNYLLHLGVDVNAEDRWGKTPLVYALRRRLSTIAKLIESSGGRVHKDHDVSSDWQQTLSEAPPVNEVRRQMRTVRLLSATVGEVPGLADDIQAGRIAHFSNVVLISHLPTIRSSIGRVYKVLWYLTLEPDIEHEDDDSRQVESLVAVERSLERLAKTKRRKRMSSSPAWESGKDQDRNNDLELRCSALNKVFIKCGLQVQSTLDMLANKLDQLSDKPLQEQIHSLLEWVDGSSVPDNAAQKILEEATEICEVDKSVDMYQLIPCQSFADTLTEMQAKASASVVQFLDDVLNGCHAVRDGFKVFDTKQDDVIDEFELKEMSGPLNALSLGSLLQELFSELSKAQEKEEGGIKMHSYTRCEHAILVSAHGRRRRSLHAANCA